MRFLLDLLYSPIRVLGFESRTFAGTVDHGKFWTTMFAVWCMWFVTLNPIHFSILFVLAIGSMLFGRAMWGRYLETKSVTGQVNMNSTVSKIDTTNTTRVIFEERDSETGIQPTHE